MLGQDWESFAVQQEARMALIYASQSGYMDIVEYLVGEKHVPIHRCIAGVSNVIEEGGRKTLISSPLCQAITTRPPNRQIIEYLLAHLQEGEVDYQDEAGFTILHHLSTTDEAEAEWVEFFLRGHAATYNLPCIDNHTAACYAAMKGQTDVVRVYMRHAEEFGHKEELIQCSCGGTENGKNRMPLLFHAVVGKQQRLIKWLAETGEVDLQQLFHADYILGSMLHCQKEISILHYAAEQEEASPIIEFLVNEMGMPVDLLGGRLQTALHAAAGRPVANLDFLPTKRSAATTKASAATSSNDQLETIKTLLRLGADKSLRDKIGMLASDYAYAEGNTDAWECLTLEERAKKAEEKADTL